MVGNWFTGNTSLYRREALIAIGGFPGQLTAYADSFVAQVLALRHGACFVPRVLGEWRRLAGGQSSAFGRDAVVQEAVRTEAVRLMLSEYRGLFPVLFVYLWSNEMRLAIGKSRLASWRANSDGGALVRMWSVVAAIGLHLKNVPLFAVSRRLMRTVTAVEERLP
jgi:hypothetical protein